MHQTTRPRLRDIGFRPGHFETGPLNAITDVEGVTIGHSTVIEGDTIRTRRNRDPAAWRQPVSGQGARRLRRL
ncbi:UNVERIFIED_ORG: L-aminopeptidase/D-esterase-like protein [Rhizobium sp. SORGH_AS260]|nr:L-aminopeptidase/D-esterase-like protein [Rhizobium sp. SORGH_AS_0260]